MIERPMPPQSEHDDDGWADYRVALDAWADEAEDRLAEMDELVSRIDITTVLPHSGATEPSWIWELTEDDAKLLDRLK